MSVGRTEAYNEQVGISNVANDLKVGNLDVGYLLLAQASHQVVVLGVGRDGSRVGVLLQSTQDMGESLATRNSPVAGTILSAHVGSPLALQLLRNVGRIDGIELGYLGQFKGTGAVGDISVSQQHDRGHVLQRYLTSLIGSVEAVGRT